MSAIDITTTQNSSFLDPVDGLLHRALGEGVTVNLVPVLAPIQGYSALTAAQQQLIRDTFRLVLASMFENMAGISTTVVVGLNTLTFTNGILTSVS